MAFEPSALFPPPQIGGRGIGDMVQAISQYNALKWKLIIIQLECGT